MPCSYLIACLAKVLVIVDNLSTSYDKKFAENAEIILHDIRSVDGLARQIAGSQIILHLAGNSNGSISVEKPNFDYEVNAIGTKNILKIGREIGVECFIYLSSASVYGKPSSFPIQESHPNSPILPYGKSKLAGELFCKEFLQHFPIVIARPFCVYGNGENPKTSLVEVTRYLRWHLNHQPIQIVGNSIAKTRDFIHVRDVVSALIVLLKGCTKTTFDPLRVASKLAAQASCARESLPQRIFVALHPANLGQLLKDVPFFLVRKTLWECSLVVADTLDTGGEAGR